MQRKGERQNESIRCLAVLRTEITVCGKSHFSIMCNLRVEERMRVEKRIAMRRMSSD